MTSGAKTVDLRLNLIEEPFRDIKRALQRFFFKFFLAVILLEKIEIVGEKVNIFSKFEL